MKSGSGMFFFLLLRRDLVEVLRPEKKENWLSEYWRKPCWGLSMMSGRKRVTFELCVSQGRVGMRVVVGVGFGSFRMRNFG